MLETVKFSRMSDMFLDKGSTILGMKLPRALCDEHVRVRMHLRFSHTDSQHFGHRLIKNMLIYLILEL